MEIICTIAIIGIVSTITAINMQSNQYILLKNSTALLVHHIRYIQAKSISQKSTGYKIYANYGFDDSGYRIFIPNEAMRYIKLNKGIKFVATPLDCYVSFTATGSPSKGTSFILKDNKDNKFQITIEVSTGRVKTSKM